MCDALVYAWYPARPAASRSPISYSATGSRSAGCRSRSRGSSAVLPVAYNERLEWTVRYVDAEAAAEFPFGAGLGYTTWALGTAVDASAYGGDTSAYGGLENAGLAARLSNTGRRRGSTVVQLYARVRRPGLLPRKAVLAGFIRVTMGAAPARRSGSGSRRTRSRGSASRRATRQRSTCGSPWTAPVSPPRPPRPPRPSGRSQPVSESWGCRVGAAHRRIPALAGA